MRSPRCRKRGGRLQLGAIWSAAAQTKEDHMRGTDGRGLCLAVLLATATAAGALTPTEKCEVDKLKAAGKYGFCRLKAEAKAVKSGDPVDYGKCDEKYADK